MRRAAFAAVAVTLVAMLGVKTTSSEEPTELVVADVGVGHQFKQFGHDVLRRQYVELQQRKAREMSAAELQKAIDEMEDELGPPVEPELLPVLEQLQEIARTRVNHPTLWHKAMLAEELLRTHDAKTLNAERRSAEGSSPSRWWSGLSRGEHGGRKPGKRSVGVRRRPDAGAGRTEVSG